MMNSIKSEFRKLLTIRSTYIIMGLAALLILLIAGFAEGYRGTQESLQNPTVLINGAKSSIALAAIFSAIVAILFFTHEYRYNTIIYTLTASKSRTQTLLAKVVVISCFALVVSLFAAALWPLMINVGAQLHGLSIAPQSIAYGDLLRYGLFYGWAFTMFGLLFAAIIRNQVGSIVAIFVLPGTLEGLVGLLLKENSRYLPFNALNSITMPGPISSSRGVLVVLIYLVVGWLIAWQLFLRRDAN